MTGIILCGGRSTRMGADKGSLAFGGETMLERITRLLRTITDEVIIVGRRDQSAATVNDAVEDQGPLAGIIAGLVASRSELNIVVACDMPLINPEVLTQLAARIGDADACVAIHGGHASALCAVYRASVLATARALFDAGERRVMGLLDAVKTERLDAEMFRQIDPALDTFKSVDTPDGYRSALAQRSLLPDR